jgi:hypothetical protein
LGVSLLDEIAEAIGSLRAGLDAIARRQDAMQLERAAQHTEALTRLLDVQAQIHEIKHAQNNDAVKFGRIEQVIAHHGTAMADHQRASEVGMAGLRAEIIANRIAAEERDVGVRQRLDDFNAWRNRVYGAIALIMVALTVLGKDIWAAITHLMRRLWG